MKTILPKIGMLIAVLLGSLSAYAYDFEVNGVYYDVVSVQDLTCEVVSGDEKYSGEVIIPTEVTYKNRNFKVTSIGWSCFWYCGDLKSIVIGDSVTTIKGQAFYSCDSLTSVVIPNAVTTIGESAFAWCSSLKEVTISKSLETIEDECFRCCTSLKKIIIPNSVTYIGKEVFRYCSALESIELGNQLKSIGMEAFDNCRSLQSFTVPGSVETIDWGYVEHKVSGWNIHLTFGDCESLDEMQFLYGDNALEVECLVSDLLYSQQTLAPLELERLFVDREIIWGYYSDLPNLKELTFGSHLSKCTKDFSRCDDLETITCYSTIPPKVSDFSNNQYMNVTVKVPREALEAYRKADIWKIFWNIEGLEYDAVEDIKADAAQKSVIGRYDMNGQSVSNDYHGLVIVRFSDGSCNKIFNR